MSIGLNATSFILASSTRPQQHPATLSGGHVEWFLSHLASERNVAASTQNQAKSAILFLYKEVLGVELPWLDDITQAKTPALAGRADA